MGRQPNRRPKIFRGSDGWYHCHPTIGTKPDGSPNRPHIRRRTAAAVAEALDELLQRSASGAKTPTKRMTVAEWLTHYLEQIVRTQLRHKTYEAYRPIIMLHLIPRIGQWRLSGTSKLLQPEHIEAAYASLREAGMADSYILQCHRVLNRALKLAHRRGHASRNPCALFDPPTIETRKQVAALDMDAVKAILRAVVDDPMRTRWFASMLTGLRQGEILGWRWSDLYLDAKPPHLKLAEQNQRRSWRHGCMDPGACAAPHCRTKQCQSWQHGCPDPGECKAGQQPRCCPQRRPAPCRDHKGRNGCPPLCKPGCTNHARACPEKTGGGIVRVTIKGGRRQRQHDGTRPVELPTVLVDELLREHEIWKAKRDAAGDRWHQVEPGVPSDLVFCGPEGQPIDARRDHERWEQVLIRAGVPDAHLHAGRHSAATLFIATGTDIRIVQDMLGHSDIRVTEGYSDVAAKQRHEAVERLADALFDGDLKALLHQSNAPVRSSNVISFDAARRKRRSIG